MWSDIAVFLGAIALAHWLKWRGFFSGVHHPASFFGLPGLGVIPWLFLRMNPLERLKEMSEEHGPLLRFRIGVDDVIVVNGTESVKEALRNDDLIGRPKLRFFQVVQQAFHADPFIVLEGETWRRARNFSIQSLRELGFGKTPKMENYIEEELEYFLEEISEASGKSRNFKQSILTSVSNNISTLVFGERMSLDNPKRKMLNDYLSSFVENASALGIYNFIPFLFEILYFFKFPPVMRFQTNATKASHIFLEKKEAHLENFVENDKRDLMDHMIAAQRKAPQLFTDRIIHGTFVGFFGAGSHTTRNTLEYLFQLCAAHPQIQDQLYAEIVREIGTSRLPKWADRDKLHLTNAFITERHRFNTIVPFGVYRRALRDTQLCGFDIKKGTVVAYNLHSVHFDEKFFENPAEFRPQRFLNAEGKFVASKNVIPFAIGKRACPGETMAVFEIFLYFVAVLQRFHIDSTENQKIRFSKVSKFFSEPIDQELRFVKRT